jgi:hypothetical protein
MACFLKELGIVRMQPIDSSAISAVGYDDQREILRVTYRSGRTYDYFDVPTEENRRFMAAESRGEYMNTIIKPNYECREV